MKKTPLKKFSVLGAGSWGTALATHLARCGHLVCLWGHSALHMSQMQEFGRNSRYFPEKILPDTIKIEVDLKKAIAGASTLVIAVPSLGFQSLIATLAPFLSEDQGIVWGTKGLDLHQNPPRFLHELLEDVLGNRSKNAILSGPSFALEVMENLPTSVVIAGPDQRFVSELVRDFKSPFFSAIPSDDMIGVEIAGVMKNITAVAGGIAEGLKLGRNARSILITYGLHEMQALGLALGGQLKTFTGLAGIGDLTLTATSTLSRNYRFGIALGQGQSVKQASHTIDQHIESKNHIQALIALADQYQTTLPMTDCLFKILNGHMPVKKAMDELWERIAL